MKVSTTLALMRRGLFASVVSLGSTLAACGHGRVSADADAQPARSSVTQREPGPAPATSPTARNASADMGTDSDSPHIVGALSADEINRIVHALRGDLRGCYVAPLRETPTLAGKLNVNFTISSTGSVSEVRISQSSLNHASLEDCVRRLILAWHFPKPTDGGVVRVAYPFNFEPHGIALKDANKAPFHVIRPIIRPPSAGGVPQLDPDEISVVIRQRRGEVRACYDAEPQKSPTLAGRVSVRLTIASAGTVSEAEISDSTLNHEAVERCVLGVVLTFQFPPLRDTGVVVVTYPFHFSP